MHNYIPEETFHPQYITDMVEGISTITGTSIEDIHSFVAANTIKYSDVRDVANNLKVMPSKEDADFIGLFGIDHYLNLKGIEV